jgi:uncharacterized membrane protein YfcA
MNHTTWIFLLYLSLVLIYGMLFFPILLNNLVWPTWLIAPIMAFGSFVAGCTFLGGGSVAFPALTKLLAIEASEAKLFSLAIQSVGMTAASIYIVVSLRVIPYAFIALYSFGSLFGLLLSLLYISPLIASTDLRVLFSAFLLCFLLVYLVTRQSQHTKTTMHLAYTRTEVGLTLSSGLAGGLISGLIGSGADLIGFCLMALYFRLSIKSATQISVILMAVSSLVGLGIQTTLISPLSPQTLSLWYIAAPVVLFGAPIGAIICKRLSPLTLLTFICIIVACEVASTLYLIPLEMPRLTLYIIGTLFSVFLFMGLRNMSDSKHTKEEKQ